MNDIVRRLGACRVCGQDNWLDLLDLGAHPLANGFLPPAREYQETAYPLEVIACRNCWLMSIRHVVDPEVLFGDYVYLTSTSDLITGHMRHIVASAVEHAGLVPGDLVVELGSNIGTQLGFFRDAGMRVTGVDPARNLAEIANADGIPTLPTFFGPAAARRVAEEQGRTKFVLGRQCFAHIDDVHEVLDGVTEVLDPEGVVAIEVPYLLNLIDENQFDTIFHEHLSYYSFGTLTHLFARHGLRMIDVARAAVHGGSIIVYATPDGASHRARPAVAELTALEHDRGLDTERPYLEFAARVEHVTSGILELVRSLRAQGKRVAGYGAPSKGCALLQFCGLDADDLDYCTDTTPAKQGTVTPGTHIPVCSPESAKADPPDYYLLLAWNYAEEIIGKESGFLAGGGKFIVPIPEPRIVSAASEQRAA